MKNELGTSLNSQTNSCVQLSIVRDLDSVITQQRTTSVPRSVRYNSVISHERDGELQSLMNVKQPRSVSA